MEPDRSDVWFVEAPAAVATSRCSIRIALAAKERARSAVRFVGEAASLALTFRGNGFAKVGFNRAYPLPCEPRDLMSRDDCYDKGAY